MHKVPAMDLVQPHNRRSCISLQVIGSHMEMFSEIQWKKSSATTQELACNCRSESVLRSVN